MPSRNFFFAMDHNNYAKYLTIYLVSLLNANHTHPGVEQLLRDDGFSVSRSSVTNSRIAVDQTIEQTSIDVLSCPVESLVSVINFKLTRDGVY